MDVLDSVEKSFSASYAEAREKFLGACEAQGVAPRAYDNPLPGPTGEALAADVAWFGPEDARRVFMMISATHGAEGFCGSACQLDWLTGGGPARLPADSAVKGALGQTRLIPSGEIDLVSDGTDFSTATLEGSVEQPAWMDGTTGLEGFFHKYDVAF